MRPALLVLVATLACGCGSKESVSLSARIGNVQLSVEQKTLGTALSGSFDLQLELGPEASGDTSVSLESLALLREGQAVVSPLQATPQGTSFPVQVGKGQTKTVPFVVDDSTLLDAAVKDAICAGPLSVSGSVTDTLGGGRTTLVSPAVTPGGC